MTGHTQRAAEMVSADLQAFWFDDRQGNQNENMPAPTVRVPTRIGDTAKLTGTSGGGHP